MKASQPAERMLDLVVTFDVVDTVVYRDDDDAVVVEFGLCLWDRVLCVMLQLASGVKLKVLVRAVLGMSWNGGG